MTEELIKNNQETKIRTTLYDHENIIFESIINEGDASYMQDLVLLKNRVQFFFGLEGKTKLHFGPYIRTIDAESATFLYNPMQEIAFQMEVDAGARLIILFIPLEKLHKLFSADDLPILKNDVAQQKFYQEKPISQSLLITLNQLFRNKINKNLSQTYHYGKLLEIISLYFSVNENESSLSCPFLNDANILKKIKEAKEILLADVSNPPTIAELARKVNIVEYQLKSGFKELYGNTIASYVLAKKMDTARKLFDTQHLKVNEVAYDLGYANPSHFITAFKNQFGMTPKKYLMKK